MSQLSLVSDETPDEWAAEMSACGQYRYILRRRVRTVQPGNHHGTVLWIMCNPSIADHYVDDPTIRRCLSFSAHWGYGTMAVANAYALRSPKPEALWRVADPVGPLNDSRIQQLVAEARLVVAAWGADVKPDRAAHVVDLVGSTQTVYCLGTTKSGAPRHPLYVSGNTPLAIYQPTGMP